MQLMKRFTPIAAIAVGSLLLAGCELKRNICANHATSLRPSLAELADFYNQLEIEAPMPEGYNAREKAIWQFCEFYKS